MFLFSAPFHIFYSFVAYPSLIGFLHILSLSMCLYYAYSTLFQTKHYIKLQHKIVGKHKYKIQVHPPTLATPKSEESPPVSLSLRNPQRELTSIRLSLSSALELKANTVFLLVDWKERITLWYDNTALRTLIILLKKSIHGEIFNFPADLTPRRTQDGRTWNLSANLSINHQRLLLQLSWDFTSPLQKEGKLLTLLLYLLTLVAIATQFATPTISLS